MSIVGFLAGFIFSMPVAGPISILVTSNALKGKIRYCNQVIIGASFADFIYVYLSVFGITKMYSFIKPAMPYILGVGALLIFYIGFKIFRSRVDKVLGEDKHPKTGKPLPKDKGGVYAGFMINFLNPTLLFGSFTTSVLVISFISSLGFNTGGMDTMIDQNVQTMNTMQGRVAENPQGYSYFKPDTLKFLKNHPPTKPTVRPSWFPLVISLSYALFLALGSITWFLTMAVIIARFRHRINVRIINGIIRSLGIVLCLFGLYFAYTAVRMFL